MLFLSRFRTLLLFVCAFAFAAAGSRDLARAQQQTDLVPAVYQDCSKPDRCTLLVQDHPTTVTISNLAAPNPDAACPRERAHAEAALARLTELLATATLLQLTDLQPSGPASVTARILVDSQDVTILLTETGHASFRTAKAPDWCQR